MATTLLELLTAVPTGAEPTAAGEPAHRFESLHLPVRMGNAANIAYGGCALGFAIHAAAQTVPGAEFFLYSVLGHYLGPALTTAKLRCVVTTVRSTRTFATRQVAVFQVINGKERSVVNLLADFHKREPATMLEYSAPPHIKYSSAQDSQTPDDVFSALPEDVIPLVKDGFKPILDYLDWRSPKEGVNGQNVLGAASETVTDQDHLPMTEKTSADWFKANCKLAAPGEHVAAAAFILDTAVSFIPLTHNHQFLYDAAACSSLDFALRFFSNDVRADAYHLREVRTVAGGSGRTYSESRYWDEAGHLVASMTQQSILRPHKL